MKPLNYRSDNPLKKVAKPVLQAMIFSFLVLTASNRLQAADALRTDTAVYPHAAIAVERLNVFYVGIDNPVSIGVTGASEDKISVTINGGGNTITKTDDGRYIVQVAKATDNCFISVLVNGKVVSTSQFRVRYLPTPVATVGGQESGATVSAAALAAQQGVMVSLKGVPIDISYQVKGFRITVLDDKNKVKFVDCTTAAFSPEAKESITKYSKPGDLLQISNITAQDAGGRTMRVPALIYNIQ